MWGCKELEKVCIPCAESWKMLLTVFYAVMKSYTKAKVQDITKLSKRTLSER
jgi:hypothetical protein